MRIIGHKNILKQINHLLDAEQIAHAYLFVGPEHVGKATVAQAFAAALVSGEKMCGELLTHPDIKIVRPEQVTTKNGAVQMKDIGVEEARKIAVDAAQTPFVGARRIIVVMDADRLTTAAQNALLKTLEEPAAKTVILFTATREGRLLSTVRSRMQRFALTAVDDATMREAAHGFFDTDKEVAAMVRAAHGCPGALMNCVVDDDVRAWYMQVLADADRVLTMPRAERIAFAAAAAQDTVRLAQMIVVWMYVWRAQLTDAEDAARERLVQALEGAQHALNTLSETNAQPRLTLEHFLLSFA